MAGLGNITVLVVDDNFHMISIVSTILKGFGVGHVLTAKDGATALELISASDVDIIFTDYRMDFLDGEELVRLIRNSGDSTNRFIPIIMLTGYSELKKVRAVRDAGIDEFVRKPVTPKEIYAKMVAVVNRQRPFVKSPSYFGPDRRRQNKPLGGRADRRKND